MLNVLEKDYIFMVTIQKSSLTYFKTKNWLENWLESNTDVQFSKANTMLPLYQFFVRMINYRNFNMTQFIL